MTHGIWDELLGQPEAIEQLQQAVATKESGVAHAWLFTGPAGSGRSNLAKAFAAALECGGDGCGICQQCKLVLAEAHPDVTILRTDRVVISIDEIREVVSRSSMGTTMGRYRVIIIEDADRMVERTSNVMLKVLEEPAENTIWILCAPSVSDLLPTIRSRTRSLNLRLPSVEEVATLLIQRDNVEPKLAKTAATQAQNHVGMARRLALSSDARARRSETLRLVLSIRNLSNAMVTAEKLLGVAKRDAEAIGQERDQSEKSALLKAYGLDENEKIPPNLRSFFKDMEENQKRRQTRALRDGIDRIFTDMESIFRDVMSLQLGSGTALINQDISSELEARALDSKLDTSISILDSIATARARLNSNSRDLLVLESLCTKLINRGSLAA